jgi:eukaryotic-like serine/threonine-protein kinase
MDPEGGAQGVVDRLLAEGRHAEAAAAARAAGQPGRALAIYERIWDFRAAAACAREAGDEVAELRNLIDARALDEADALAARLVALGGERAIAAAEVLESRRLWDKAGSARERLGDDDRAAALYQRGDHLLDAARVREKQGRLREAGRLLERLLERRDAAAGTGVGVGVGIGVGVGVGAGGGAGVGGGADVGEAGADAAARAAAQLALGRILGRLGHHREAARQLQEAARDPGARPAAQKLIVVEMAAMGLRDAAADALAAAREADPALPLTVDEAVRAIVDAGASGRAAGAGEPAVLVGGRYRLVRQLGAGGSGRVYLARDEVSGADVAVKLFYAAHARGHEAYERFVREARIWGSGRHPNIVDVIDFREELGFFVMEYLAGGTLADRLDPRAAPPIVRRAALDVLAALGHAHARGVVHRDIKPANVFFDGHGTAKLGDFGVAHLLDLGQTQTGALIGTLAYMAPEQVTGAPLTGAADLYALGVTLFQALTGRLPFVGPDYVAQHLGDPPPRASEVHAELGTAWDQPLLDLLAKDPGARPGVAEVRARLGRLELGERRAVLVLPRAPVVPDAGAGAGASVGADATREAPAPPGVPAGAARPSAAARYQAETVLATTPMSTLARALDATLARTVVLERFAEAEPDERSRARLERFAAATTPFLQRVLAWDRAERLLVLEAPAGDTLAVKLHAGPLPPRAAARLLLDLARALAPIHEAGGAHGAVDADRVVIDEAGAATLMCAGLGRAPTELAPAQDVAACLELAARALHATSALLPALAARLPERAASGLAAQPLAHAGDLLAFAHALDRALARAER